MLWEKVAARRRVTGVSWGARNGIAWKELDGALTGSDETAAVSTASSATWQENRPSARRGLGPAHRACA